MTIAAIVLTRIDAVGFMSLVWLGCANRLSLDRPLAKAGDAISPLHFSTGGCGAALEFTHGWRETYGAGWQPLRDVGRWLVEVAL